MKIRPVGTELFHVDLQTDRQTDRQTYKQADITKLIITFRNYSNATKILQTGRHNETNNNFSQLFERD